MALQRPRVNEIGKGERGRAQNSMLPKTIGTAARRRNRQVQRRQCSIGSGDGGMRGGWGLQTGGVAAGKKRGVKEGKRWRGGREPYSCAHGPYNNTCK